MRILGIETSCDETAAAVVQDGQLLLSNAVTSSMNEHVRYGGIVPEIAARSQLETINSIIHQALEDASCSWEELDGIAVSYGPGLGGSLLIGVMTARTLALAHKKLLYAVNHVTAHVYVNFLTATPLPEYTMDTRQPEFPFLAIIVSGGHSQLVLFHSHIHYEVLGHTRDDAIGEAFDKVAKLLGLPYPGGPSIARAALAGNPFAFPLPKAKMDYLDFSFSGLKTAVLRLAQAQIGEDYNFPSIKLAERLSEPQKADIAASFQRIAIEAITDKVRVAFDKFGPKSVVIAGGVAASQELRHQLNNALPYPPLYPDPKLCTDNGAMVATLGCYQVSLGQAPADPYTLTIQPNLSMQPRV